MAKVFIIDVDHCNGCYACQYACKDEHVGNNWLPYAVSQPNTGQFWMKVDEREHGAKPRVRVEYTPRLCMHCEDAPCMEVAPEAVYRRADGLVIVDPEKAKGNRALVDACPYGAIYWNAELDVPQKCTGCAHLVDEGKLPHCVDICGQGALRFGDEEEFAGEIDHAEVLFPEYGTSPRVYYLNRPHLFINGEVWDPKTDEIIEGAIITLVMPDGSTKIGKTDDFGEFWFKKLDTGIYSLIIKAQGYESVVREDIEIIDKGINLGDFALQR